MLIATRHQFTFAKPQSRNSKPSKIVWEKPLRITQAHLKVLAESPHRFQRQFLDDLGMPSVAGNAEAIARGKQFHQLMHQRSLQLPVEALVEGDRDLQRYFEAYEQQPPSLLEGDRVAEYPLATPLSSFQLFGVLDVLVRNADRMQIVDWKTYRRALTAERLKEDWQTRLYLFLLAEWSGLAPENLSMVYWFAEAPELSVEIGYSAGDCERDRRDISALLEKLNSWLESGQFPASDNVRVGFTMPSVESIPPLPLP